MRRLLPLVFLLVAGCGPSAEDPTPVGSTAPDITVETLSIPSSNASLSKRRGKVVLLDFWATWCGPCKKITPFLESVYALHKDKGLEAMAITTESREVVSINERQRPHAMPVYIDSTEKASRAFGAEGLPTIVVVDREGHIVYRVVGVPPEPTEISDAVVKALGKA